MAASTGPAENNTIPVQTVELGDTFNLWRDVTNTAIYKINKLKVYDVVDSTSISNTLSAGGTLSVSLADNVNKGLTFQQPVLFQSGVTFNGPVTFNAQTVTLNANIVTIDDYNIVLGDTAEATDSKIDTAGGGGILLNRGGGSTAEWLWRPIQVHGITGVWRANTHIGFSGSSAGIYPHNGGSLRIHGSGFQVDGGSTTDHGFAVNLTTSGAAGTTANRTIEFLRDSPAGATVFMQVLNGSTYGNQPFVNIPAGANRKIINQSHTFVFGQPLYLNASVYTSAKADDEKTSEVVGIVSRVIDASNFEITFLGEIFGDFTTVTETGTALTTGSVYYLSPFVAGKITPSQPSSASLVHKALLIATGSNSAIVYPFTGGVLASPVNISTATSLGIEFGQLNRFRIGDFVRWSPNATTLTYVGSDSVTYTNTYPNGVYVKAQANSSLEAELAGMVIATSDASATGTSGVNSTFTLLMDGFFSGLSLPASYGTPINGTVYFLASNCAGTSNALESNTACFATNPPTAPGSIRKPLFMATSGSAASWSGYLFSYRGDEAGVQGLSADTRFEDLLIQNLGSCGSAEDLRFGVRIGNGVAGGQQVMRLPHRRPGCVDIGFAGTANNGATLDVRGVVRAGRDNAVNGGEILVSRYPVESSSNSTYPETLNVFGSQFSTGNSVISYGIRPRNGSSGYESTSGVGGLGNQFRTALEIGITSAVPGMCLVTTAQTAVAQGTAVAATELFTVTTSSMRYNGGLALLNTTSDQALRVVGNSLNAGVHASSLVTLSNPKNTISLFLGDGASTTSYGNDEYNGNIRFNGAGTFWGDISYYPNPGTNPYFRFTLNGSAVQATPNASVGAGSIRLYDTTASSSTTTGALRVAGGVGVAGALYAANINSGTLNASNTTASTSTTTGALTVAGGVGVAGTINTAGITTASLSVGTATMSTPSGSAPLFGARAWVSFNTGYNASGVLDATTNTTRQIYGSGNIASVTRIGAANSTADLRFRVAFNTAMPNANYAVAVMCTSYTNGNATGNSVCYHTSGADANPAKNTPSNKTTTSFDIIIKNSATANTFGYDNSYVSLIVFG